MLHSCEPGPEAAPATRTRRLMAVAGALLVGIAGAGAGLTLSAAGATPVCGPGGEVLDLTHAALVCAHADEAPPGVDVTEPVSTAELKERPGAADAAYRAAEDLGVPGYYEANASSPSVPCDGDGTSGYRVQAMYVVEQSKANRYASLASTFKLWAAGADDVINRSAALTGGVRHLRYVTDPDGGGCTARVLNVTVPDGSMSSFTATINAVKALGYASPARKYLMWTDATALCGIATTYPYDTDGQGNPNNGSYAQYARIDSGCWGFGNGSNQHSVEAHEIVHTLGGVMRTAPHGTTNGHCWDESDTMCYADGGGYAMVQVCDRAQEYLLDCNSDDYFSTYPDPGSYLDTHWNAADNRFLIGGGDGSGGGSMGAPTALGATLAVNNPAIPGLPTQAEVSPALPSGRTLTSVAWRAGRSDCVFTAPTELVTDVVCNAGAATATSVTATITDSTGATKTASSPLTFTTATPRDVVVGLALDSQSAAGSSTASVCTSTSFPVSLTAIDAATGVPVKGLTLSATKQADGSTSVVSVGSKASDATGTSALSTTTSVVTTVTARSTAVGVWRAATPVAMRALPTTCKVDLTVDASPTSVYYGDPVPVTGSLTRSLAGERLPVSGVSVALKVLKPGGSSLALGSVRTAADGTYRAVVKPTASGQLLASVAGTAGLTAVTANGPALTVTLPETDLAASAGNLDVGYGEPVTATGRLRRDAGGAVTPIASAPISLTVTAPGRTPVVVGSGRTRADGTFTVSGALRVTGTLKAVYAGAAGQPAASIDLGQAIAGTWQTTLTAASSASSVVLGGAVTLSGSLTKSYGGTTKPAGSQRVTVWFTPKGGVPTLVTTVTTTSAGAWTTRVYPKATGTWKAVMSPVAGYGGSESEEVAVSVS